MVKPQVHGQPSVGVSERRPVRYAAPAVVTSVHHPPRMVTDEFTGGAGTRPRSPVRIAEHLPGYHAFYLRKFTRGPGGVGWRFLWGRYDLPGNDFVLDSNGSPIIVRSNTLGADSTLTGMHDPDTASSVCRNSDGSLDWIRRNGDELNLAWAGELSAERRLATDGVNIYCLHGASEVAKIDSTGAVAWTRNAPAGTVYSVVYCPSTDTVSFVQSGGFGSGAGYTYTSAGILLPDADGFTGYPAVAGPATVFTYRRQTASVTLENWNQPGNALNWRLELGSAPTNSYRLQIKALAATSDGGVVVLGRGGGNPAGMPAYADPEILWLIKHDSANIVVWQSQMSAVNYGAIDVTVDADDNVFALVSTDGAQGRPAIRAYTAAGSFVDETTLFPGLNSGGTRLKIDAAGDAYVAGYADTQRYD